MSCGRTPSQPQRQPDQSEQSMQPTADREVAGPASDETGAAAADLARSTPRRLNLFGATFRRARRDDSTRPLILLFITLVMLVVMAVMLGRDGGDEAPVSGSATANTPAAGRPAIMGTVHVGQLLTVSTSEITDEDGLDGATFRYRWLADGIPIDGAASSSYRLTEGELGKSITLRVAFNDDRKNLESLTSPATPPVTRPPLTASVEAVPGSHDGRTRFSFELRFSDDVEISDRALRDHAFAVTGGEVTRAERLQPGQNSGWLIHVQPDGDGPVSVQLPATTDCQATGAICTGDGRTLADRVELTVPGPGG